MNKTNYISFILDGKQVNVDFTENSALTLTTTVLNYLRSYHEHKGVKEGCAEGDCGACTIVIVEKNSDGVLSYKSVDSCLMFLPMIHGKQIITIENLEQYSNNKLVLHPVQKEMVERFGSQCGYCTPGIVMSLFALYKNHYKPSKEVISDALTGNLCRCTGYQPIIEAAESSCSRKEPDHFSKNEKEVSSILSKINKSHTIYLASKNRRYFIPFTITEALRLKKEYPEAIIVSGATDIALRQNKKNEILSNIIDLSHIEELRLIYEDKKHISFGAGVRIEEIKSFCAGKLPALHKILCVFGSLQIRNIATIGGNVGSASPIGDTLPVLFAYKAKVIVRSLESERIIPIQDFITGYRITALNSDEIITSIEIPISGKKENIWSCKVSKRKDLDISTVSAGFNLLLDSDNMISNIVLAFGGMAAYTVRATKTEHFLTNKLWCREHVEEAMKILYSEFSPISDARSDAEFRRHAAKNLLLKFWAETS